MNAAKKAPSASTEPTDRSIPPLRMTSICPAARMQKTGTWSATFNRLVRVRKLGESSEETMINSTSSSSDISRCKVDSVRTTSGGVVAVTRGSGPTAWGCMSLRFSLRVAATLQDHSTRDDEALGDELGRRRPTGQDEERGEHGQDQPADERAPHAAHAAQQRGPAYDHGGDGGQLKEPAVVIGVGGLLVSGVEDAGKSRQEAADGVDEDLDAIGRHAR